MAMQLRLLEIGNIAARRQQPDPYVTAAVRSDQRGTDRQPALGHFVVPHRRRRLGRLDVGALKTATWKAGNRCRTVLRVLAGSRIDEAWLGRDLTGRARLTHHYDR